MGLRRVLIADDEESIRHVLTVLLQERGYEVRAVADGEEALRELSTRDYDALVTDVRMPKMNGLELVRAAQAASPETTIIVMSAYGSHDLAIDAMKAGAYDYLGKPFRPDEVLLVLRKAEERERLRIENSRLRREIARATPQLVAEGPAMKEVLRVVQKVAPTTTTVLIEGESGTGKEVVARALHELSPRADRPFVAVNCGAIPEQLIESELFGHAKGAFTDARAAKRGLFEEADGGTILLDEVGELPLQLQPALLRVLQEGEVRRVGDSRSTRVDVRVLAATNRDLGAQVQAGRFREDLYYRLNVVGVKLPPLRERPDEIKPLSERFLSLHAGRMGLPRRQLSARALDSDDALPLARQRPRAGERARARAGALRRGRDRAGRAAGAGPRLRRAGAGAERARPRRPLGEARAARARGRSRSARRSSAPAATGRRRRRCSSSRRARCSTRSATTASSSPRTHPRELGGVLISPPNAGEVHLQCAVSDGSVP